MSKKLPANSDEFWAEFLSKVDRFGNSPLHNAVRSNSLKYVVLYLYCKADKNMKNCFGKTPIDLARELNYDGIVAVLEKDDG